MLAYNHPVAVVGASSEAASHSRAAASVARSPLASLSSQPDKSGPLCAVGSLVAALGCGRLHTRRQCRRVARKAGDHDELLIQAGLRNLLGVEENRMAKKLEDACQVSSDLKRCLSDIEVKHKVAMDEVSELQKQVTAAEAEKQDLKAQLEELSAKVEEMKKKTSMLEAKNSEQWAAQKTVESERDEAVRALAAAKEEATAAQLKAENQVKGARAETEAAKAELQAAKAELKATASPAKVKPQEEPKKTAKK
eukprot:TRINITY_DN11904_c0_g1_i1.p1 TRINITY_DN11904_c0_g1~~TRINITY_DN11904_c0_g1_i1.p1  ORF type:complete len:252 (-),score=86.14 TRINITY_DN11904_c0_g1_i1:76-831(-)